MISAEVSFSLCSTSCELQRFLGLYTFSCPQGRSGPVSSGALPREPGESGSAPSASRSDQSEAGRLSSRDHGGRVLLRQSHGGQRGLVRVCERRLVPIYRLSCLASSSVTFCWTWGGKSGLLVWGFFKTSFFSIFCLDSQLPSVSWLFIHPSLHQLHLSNIIVFSGWPDWRWQNNWCLRAGLLTLWAGCNRCWWRSSGTGGPWRWDTSTTSSPTPSSTPTYPSTTPATASTGASCFSRPTSSSRRRGARPSPTHFRN